MAATLATPGVYIEEKKFVWLFGSSSTNSNTLFHWAHTKSK